MSPPDDSSFPVPMSCKQEKGIWNANALDDDMDTLGQSLDHMSLEDSRTSSIPPQTCKSSLSSLELLRLLQEENIPSISWYVHPDACGNACSSIPYKHFLRWSCLPGSNLSPIYMELLKTLCRYMLTDLGSFIVWWHCMISLLYWWFTMLVIGLELN